MTEPSECAICLGVLLPRRGRAAALKCGHRCFHATCISAWLLMAPTCPLCKMVVREDVESGDVTRKREQRARRRACMEAGLGRVRQEEEDVLIALELSLMRE